jgi:hypothetical protein
MQNGEDEFAEELKKVGESERCVKSWETPVFLPSSAIIAPALKCLPRFCMLSGCS